MTHRPPCTRRYRSLGRWASTVLSYVIPVKNNRTCQLNIRHVSCIRIDCPAHILSDKLAAAQCMMIASHGHGQHASARKGEGRGYHYHHHRMHLCRNHWRRNGHELQTLNASRYNTGCSPPILTLQKARQREAFPVTAPQDVDKVNRLTDAEKACKTRKQACKKGAYPVVSDRVLQVQLTP